MKFFLFVAILFGTISCGNSQMTRGTFILSYMAQGESVDGGVFVKCMSHDGLREPLYLRVDSEGNIEIPYGNWDLYVVTFAGPNFMSGDKQCAEVMEQNFNGPTAEITIDVESSRCQESPFEDVVAEIKNHFNAKWNIALWDNAVWGP